MVERLAEWYEKNWVRKDQLKQYVDLGAITEEEYKQISGEDYSA